MARSRALWRYALYGFALALAAFELSVFVLMLNPSVPPEYQAFYIDRTTTCLPQPVTGTYKLGQAVSFRWPARDLAQPLKPCGWFEVNGDGTPTKGESAMLRFAIGEEVNGPLDLTLVASPIEKDGALVPQRVIVRVGAIEAGAFTISERHQRADVTMPAQALPRGGEPLDVTLDLPDAVNFDRHGRGSNTQDRALVVEAVRLGRSRLSGGTR